MVFKTGPTQCRERPEQSVSTSYSGAWTAAGPVKMRVTHALSQITARAILKPECAAYSERLHLQDL